ncbi:MAG: HAMP domain-containing sensor histidine kinase [Chitinophagales bacterium]
MINSPNIRIAIIFSALALIALMGVQYFLVSNTYQLKNKEFVITYRNSIFDAYEDCISGGVFYNDAHTLIDSIATDFTVALTVIQSKEELDKLQKQFYQRLIANLKYYNDLDAFFAGYKYTNDISSNFDYQIVVRHVGILLGTTSELVIFEKEGDKEGLLLLGNLQDLSTDNHIMDTRSVVGNKCLIDYALYVDTPARNSLLIKEMYGIFTLSILTILTILVVFIYTIYHWRKQKKMSDMKSDFINNISHELKTPLATIAVANKSLQNGKIVNNPVLAANMVEVIDRQSKRLQKLINQVLDLTIWERTNPTLEKEPVEMNSFLATIVADFKLKQTDKPLDLEVDLSANQDIINIDKFHLTTVISNLLDNALKYSGENPIIRVKTNDNGEYLQISIEDKGMGMDRETQQHIFDKFYRGQKGNLHTVKGLGLGLYYVRKSIESHGGTIEVESKKGKGSIFRIQLPRQNF